MLSLGALAAALSFVAIFIFAMILFLENCVGVPWWNLGYWTSEFWKLRISNAASGWQSTEDWFWGM